MKRDLLLVPFAILGSFAACANAQVAGTGTPTPNRVDKRAQDMRDQIDNGKQVQSHVRVSVRLKNGNKLTGIVKDGRFVERVDGLRFVDAQAKEVGAGIRLWYSGGVRNYVFVPFADFAHYEVLQRLSTKELQEIEAQMQINEKRDAEKAAQRAADAAKAEKADKTDPGGSTEPPAPAGESADSGKEKTADKDAAATAAEEQQRLWFKLVNEYPPSAGWGKVKCDEIKRRKVVVGAVPSASEQFFADNFSQWLLACAHFGVSTEPKTDDGSGDDGKKSKRESRHQK